MQAEEGEFEPSTGQKVSDVLAFLFTPALIVLPVLEWVPGIAPEWRPWAVIAVVVLGAVGFAFSVRRTSALARERRESERKSEATRQRLDALELGHSLDHVSLELFGPGAWRLSVYQKEMDSYGAPVLNRLMTASSDADLRQKAIDQIFLKPSLFAEVFTTNLANARDRKAYQSGAYEEELDANRWSSWRDQVFGGPDALATADESLRARKFVWYATQDPDTERVVVMLAESASPTGINLEFLSASATSVWLIMAARIAQVMKETT